MPQRSDNPEYVSGREFSNWMTEQSDFRTRLEQRLGNQHGEVVVTLRRIEDAVKETNGRVRGAEGQIEGVKSRLGRLEEDDKRIEDVVQGIRDDGCSQYATHVEILQACRVSEWSAKRKAATAGGLVGLGVVVWPALKSIADVLHAWIERMP